MHYNVQLRPQIHTHIHMHYRKNSINKFRKPENIQKCQNLTVEFFRDYNTLPARYRFGK